jgi:hypothetical protein
MHLSIDKPSDASTVRTLGRPDDRVGFDYLSPRQFDILAANTSGGDVEAFTIKGSTIYVTPTETCQR